MKIRGLLVGAISVVAILLSTTGVAFAATTPDFSQTINPGTLTTDITDASRNPLASPSVAMSAKNFSFSCQTSTGTFGSASERIYVNNPSAANNGWTLSLAATGGTTDQWENTGATESFAYNSAAGSGCTNGQLAVDPSAGTLTTDCVTCSATNVSKGSSASYNNGTVDSITLLNAASSSDDVWRGYLTGVGISQAIPAEVPADTYTINLTLTATAS